MTFTKDLEPVKDFPGAAPIKIVVVPRTLQSYSGDTIAPGEKVEVIGEREISQVGMIPDPTRFCWISLYSGAGDKKPIVLASVDGRWYSAKSEKHADEVSGAEAVREQWKRDQADRAAQEERAKLAKGKMPTTLSEAQAALAEAEARADAAEAKLKAKSPRGGK